MVAEVAQLREANDRRLTAQAALSAGECYQLADGRAAYRNNQNGAASGDGDVKFKTDGIVTVIKTAGIVLLDGGRAYWDHSANAVTFRTVNDRDFYIGTVVGDAESADTSCTINLNVEPVYEADLMGNPRLSQANWTSEETNGLGVTHLLCDGVKLSFDAVVEAAQAAFYSDRTFAVTSNPILETKFAVFDKGDNAALDINIGFANGTHATNFDTVTERVSVHFDGNALDILAGSTDGTTTVAYTDTTIDAVDDTYLEVWIDCRNIADIQIYVNAVLVLPSTVFNLGVAVGPLKPIVHMEKTSDDTTADVRIEFARVRTAQQ